MIETEPFRGFLITVYPDRRVGGMSLVTPENMHDGLREALGDQPRAVPGMDDVLLPDHLGNQLAPEIAAFMSEGRKGCVAFQGRDASGAENFHAMALVAESIEHGGGSYRQDDGEVASADRIRGPLVLLTGDDNWLALL
jgi:hypothetical protein